MGPAASIILTIYNPENMRREENNPNVRGYNISIDENDIYRNELTCENPRGSAVSEKNDTFWH
jgi:hypothetical protein